MASPPLYMIYVTNFIYIILFFFKLQFTQGSRSFHKFRLKRVGWVFSIGWFQIDFFKVDLQTTNYLHFWKQWAIFSQKSTISMYRATSIFDLHMRIFNLQGLGLPTNLKKTKYAEIIFISCYKFLRVMRDQFLPNCKKTHPTIQPHFFASF
jgi:hypothetical protein